MICSFSNAQNIDFSSVDEFFNIASALQEGKKVGKVQWKRLEGSSAYRSLAQRNVDIVKSAVCSVFGNAPAAASDNLLEQLVTENYEEIDESFSDIREFRKNYDFTGLVERAKDRLRSFLLLDDLDSSVKWKPVYFFFFIPDGKDMEDALLVDFNLIFKMTEEQRVNFLAHEFFHIYRGSFKKHGFADDISFMLDMIQNEGIADQIDKYMGYEQYYSSVHKSAELKKVFAELYRCAENDIERLQATIVRYANNQIDFDSCVDELLEVYKYNGHCIGFYMSSQIVKAGLGDKMVKSYMFPYEFYGLYNMAAKKNGTVVLHDDFIKLALERTVL